MPRGAMSPFVSINLFKLYNNIELISTIVTGYIENHEASNLCS